MPFPHADSSEDSSLLENGGRNSGSLTQPFMNTSYNSNSSAGSARGKAVDATAFPLQPPEDEEAAEELRKDAVADQEDEVPEMPWAPLSGQRLFHISSMVVFVYLAVGVIVYMSLAKMKFLDALYFCIVTLTTVGYGDLSAHKASTKLFACFYILIGVAMIAAFLGHLVEIILDKQEALLIKVLKKTTAKATGAAPALKESEKVELYLGVFFFLLLVMLGTIVFKLSGDLSWIDALYFTVVSSSTVGYGDYYPQNEWTRVFAIFFLPVSTLLLGKVITDYTEMRTRESAKMREKRILLATVSVDEYKKMDTDGDNKVSPMEFMCRTLIRQDKVTQAELDEICGRFRALDQDGSGYVTWEEVGMLRDRDGDGFITMDEL